MSLSTKKFNYFKKDEKKAVQEYGEAAKKVNTKEAKELFKQLARDEATHVDILEKIEDLEKEKPKGRFGLSIFEPKKKEEEYKEKVKKHFRESGEYDAQDAEEGVAEDRPDLPEENVWEA